MDRPGVPPERLLERFGVSPEAESLWRALLTDPGASLDTISGPLGLSRSQIETAIESLKAAHLVQHSSAPAGVVAVDPALVIESHIVWAERQLSEELQELAMLRAAIPDLAAAYARGKRTGDGDQSIETIVETDDVRRQIYLAMEGVKHESRSLYHASTIEGFRDAQVSDIDALARGVRCRSIVGTEELNDPNFYTVLEVAHARGEHFRALPEVPTRLLILDRSLAVLAVDPSDLRRGAIFVRAQSLVELLVLLFDHMWSVADPIFAGPTDGAAPIGRRARVLELVAIGTKDERIARTLGVGVRTIRREISELRDSVGVSSRAELVAAAIRKGWL